MERLIGLNTQDGSVRTQRIGSILLWKMRLFAKRFDLYFGFLGWLNLLLLVVLLSMAVFLTVQQQSMSRLKRQLSVAPIETAGALAADSASMWSGRSGSSARERLNAFDDYLLESDSISQAVQDLLRNAEDQGLLIERGDYDYQVETLGGFMQLKMNLPVKGTAEAIHEFVRSALLTQPQLALDGIRFKREGVRTDEVEAQLNWILFVRASSQGLSSEVLPRIPGASS